MIMVLTNTNFNWASYHGIVVHLSVVYSLCLTAESSPDPNQFAMQFLHLSTMKLLQDQN